MSLTQTEANQRLKEKRRQERQSRSEKKRNFKETNKEAELKQKSTAKAEAIQPGEAAASDDGDAQPKKTMSVKVKGMQPELTVHPCFCRQPARRPAANTIGQDCNRPTRGR